jgi:hypothetical protein
MKRSRSILSAACVFALIAGCGTAPTPIDPAKPSTTVTESPKTEAPKAETPAPKEEPKTVEAEPKKEEVKPAPAIGGGKAVAWGKAQQFTMDVPPAWEKQEPTSRMRQLQMSIPKNGADTEDAELVGFLMPGGGGIEQNLQRWVMQMGGEGSLKGRKKIKTAGGVEAEIAELEGAYAAMSPLDGSAMPAKADYKMLGAFVPTLSGEIYLKLTGPKNTIDANKAAFEKMIETLK